MNPYQKQKQKEQCFWYLETKIIAGRNDPWESDKKAQKEAEHKVHAIKIGWKILEDESDFSTQARLNENKPDSGGKRIQWHRNMKDIYGTWNEMPR